MKKEVVSSMFSHVEYRAEEQILVLTWLKSGEDTAYYDVPAEVGNAAENAISIGSFYNQQIKNKFESDISRAAQVQNAPPIEAPIPDNDSNRFDGPDDGLMEPEEQDENEEEDF